MTLSKREKLLIKVLLVIGTAAIFYLFILSPFQSAGLKNKDLLENSRRDISALHEIYQEFNKLTITEKEIEQKLATSINLIEKIDALSDQTGIKKQRTSLREEQGRQRNSVVVRSATVRFESIPLSSAIRFIAEMEQLPGLIRISQFTARKALKGGNVFDIAITYEHYTR
jgi:hypothetical protein